jgi:hypothetical protein
MFLFQWLRSCWRWFWSDDVPLPPFRLVPKPERDRHWTHDEADKRKRPPNPPAV